MEKRSETVEPKPKEDAGDGQGDGAGMKRDEEYWLEDGTVILVARDVEFRVYSGILASNSTVFRDLFAQQDHPTRITCNIFCARTYLKATSGTSVQFVVDRRVSASCYRFLNTKWPSFHVISTSIRLGRKYKMILLYEESLSYLKKHYTNDFSDWVDSNVETGLPEDWAFAEAIGVVNLARLIAEPTLLPTAIMECTDLGKEIVRGFEREDRSQEYLTPEDLGICFLAKSALSEASIQAVLLTFQPIVSLDCKTPSTCRDHLQSVLSGLHAASQCVSDSESRVLQVSSRPCLKGRCEPTEPSSPPLPIELYREIFTSVRAHNQSAASRLPLLCQTLRYEAEDVLYHTPLLRTKKRSLAFGKTISACPRRANAVRGLAFNAWPGWEDRAAHTRRYDLTRFIEDLRRGVQVEDIQCPEPRWMAELRSSLAHLHRLTTIIIRQSGATHLVFHLLRDLDVPLRCIRGTPLAQNDVNFFTLQQFPELEEIHFNNARGGTQLVASLGLPNLRVLTCPSRMLTDVMPQSCPNLTHLNVKEVTSEDIERIVHILGPQLVSLRLEHTVWDEQGRLYPTNGPPVWRRCARLKYLHVRHNQWCHDMSRYLHDDPVDTTNLPPSLQTLVWSPAWTRVYTYHIYPDEDKRADVRRFAETVMRASRTLRTVVYEWTGRRFYRCYLGTHTECRETAELEMDEGAWTRV
ncbi:hypothetical protein L227DRAFT_654629 [Lentinus tigrinus ALCF2SS1-6]|uniref:BTB domain-containing protein n=1 Tax=Lentinus tigrinus ALCF2SS1-6 TaxID=1328759 RepID=A0A5C2S685_9APHY|nr:hypothetical protein L227DRAFT_654629 [Lentinus tigrinus ALCF2SS1-6]